MKVDRPVMPSAVRGLENPERVELDSSEPRVWYRQLRFILMPLCRETLNNMATEPETTLEEHKTTSTQFFQWELPLGQLIVRPELSSAAGLQENETEMEEPTFDTERELVTAG